MAYEENFEKCYKTKAGIVDSTLLFTKRYTLNPLTFLMDKEECNVRRDNMKKFYYSLLQNLTLDEAFFMQDTFGNQWHNKFYLQKLKHNTDVSKYLEENLQAIKERINILEQIPKEERLHFSSLPYFLTTKDETIKTYQRVLKNGNLFPKDFFRYDNGRKAGIVTYYMCNNLMELKPRKAFEEVTKKDFNEYKLNDMLKLCFDNSPKLALRGAYPESIYPGLYFKELQNTQIKDNGGLSHLINSIDEIFSQK